MKILNEEQQLIKRREELWAMTNIHNIEIEDRRKLLRKAENKCFPNKGNIRVIKWQLENMDKVALALSEYTDVLRDRLDILKEKSA